jgi:hypothetical protein
MPQLNIGNRQRVRKRAKNSPDLRQAYRLGNNQLRVQFEVLGKQL